MSLMKNVGSWIKMLCQDPYLEIEGKEGPKQEKNLSHLCSLWSSYVVLLVLIFISAYLWVCATCVRIPTEESGVMGSCKALHAGVGN